MSAASTPYEPVRWVTGRSISGHSRALAAHGHQEQGPESAHRQTGGRAEQHERGIHADSPPPDPSFSAERGEEFCHIDDFERLVGVAEDNAASQDDELVKT